MSPDWTKHCTGEVERLDSWLVRGVVDACGSPDPRFLRDGCVLKALSFHFLSDVVTCFALLLLQYQNRYHNGLVPMPQIHQGELPASRFIPFVSRVPFYSSLRVLFL